jgi:cytoskeletal protein CcmA (bactofilin family)
VIAARAWLSSSRAARESKGGFTFRGVAVSEQDIDISGTGNKIQGAVISQNNAFLS